MCKRVRDSAGAATGEEAWQQAWLHPLTAALTGQADMSGRPNRPSEAPSAGDTSAVPEVTISEVDALRTRCSSEGEPLRLLRLHVTVYALPPLLTEVPAALQALMGHLLSVQPASVQVSSAVLRTAFIFPESGFASLHMHTCNHLCACRVPLLRACGMAEGGTCTRICLSRMSRVRRRL